MNQITTAVDIIRTHIAGADLKLLAEVYFAPDSVTLRLGTTLSYNFAVIGKDVRVIMRDVNDGGKSTATVIARHDMGGTP